ncbi:MAG: alpha/beta hydrolase [Rhodobacteraceae bacterium]|nr:alpha/beta hydrolase [Paracoccaceae bacterium]
MSIRLWLLSGFTRLVIKRWLAKVVEVTDLREAFERHAKRVHIAPPFAACRNGFLGGIPVKWVSCGRPTSDNILFYVHGGGFVVGSPDTHRHMVAYLCRSLGIEAVMPRYRLAPEHPFPAGFEDVVASYRALITSGRDPSRIILGGDSAGGGLVLSLLAYISKHNLPRPKGCFALSPAVDFTRSGESMVENAASEAVLVAARFEEMSKMYLAGQDPKQPFASPLFADFPNCPPVLFHVADHEILRDDALAMQCHLLDQGADVLVRSWPNGFHVWHMMLGYIPEARQALDDIAAFIKQLP